jgi:ribosomal protein S27E
MKIELLCPEGHVVGTQNGNFLSFLVKNRKLQIRVDCKDCGKRWQVCFQRISFQQSPLEAHEH